MKAILSFALQAVMLSACNLTSLNSTQTSNANPDTNKSSATSSPTPGSTQQGASDANAIRQVDFMNRTYRGAEATVQVRNGRWQSAQEGDNSFVNVDRVIYGDLTGDGREEAVVTLGESEGGSGYFTRGEIYTLRDGQVVMVAEVEGGDRGSGGIHNIRIEGGQLIVERLEGAANNPEQIETTTYRLNGSNLTQVGEVRRRPYSEDSPEVNDQLDTPPPSQERRQIIRHVSLTPARPTAVFQGQVDQQGNRYLYVFRARRGQQLTVHLTSAENNAVCDILSGESEFSVNTVAENVRDWNGRLTEEFSTGEYTIEVRSTGGRTQYTLEITLR